MSLMPQRYICSPEPHGRSVGPWSRSSPNLIFIKIIPLILNVVVLYLVMQATSCCWDLLLPSAPNQQAWYSVFESPNSFRNCLSILKNGWKSIGGPTLGRTIIKVWNFEMKMIKTKTGKKFWPSKNINRWEHNITHNIVPT